MDSFIVDGDDNCTPGISIRTLLEGHKDGESNKQTMSDMTVVLCKGGRSKVVHAYPCLVAERLAEDERLDHGEVKLCCSPDARGSAMSS